MTQLNAEQIPERHEIWRTLERTHGAPIPMSIRREFARHPAVIAAAAGHWHENEIVRLSEKISQAELDEMKRKVEAKTRSTRPTKAGRRSIDPPIKDRHTTYVGVLANVVYGYAKEAEIDLCRAIREPLAEIAVEWERQLANKAPTHQLEDKKKPLDGLHRTYIDDGLRKDQMIAILRSAAELEKRQPPAFSNAARLMADAIENLVQKAGPDTVVADAYMAAPWAQRGSTMPQRILKVVDHENRTERLSYTRAGGYLHQLDIVGRVVGAKYRWTPEQALGFLLSDLVPICSVARIDYDIREDLPCLSSIRLTIDPTLAPDEVMALYSVARRAVLPFHKELSEKNLALANFAFAKRNDDRQDWRALMDLWNQNVAQEESQGRPLRGQRKADPAYVTPSVFKEHCAASLDRILFPRVEKPVTRTKFPSLEEFERSRSKTAAQKRTAKPTTPNLDESAERDVDLSEM